jgi:hypothetical protein
MQFVYRVCEVDVAPEFALGLHFAHVRVQLPIAGETTKRTYDSGHLAPFDTEVEAVSFARRWAIRWVDGVISGRVDCVWD